MNKSSAKFLQTVIVLIGIAALAFMIRFPLTEGRAANLDLLSIYSDPFIIYGYLASIPFFIALFQAFKLLGSMGRNELFSLGSVKALKTIKYCAIIQSILIVAAAVYIRAFHAVDDDPAGFIAISILVTVISLVIATMAGKFQRKLQKRI